jgi:parallel beta-helix repeat protein
MSERSFSSIVLGAHPREGRSRRLYRAGEVSEVCGDLATVRVDVDDSGQQVCLQGLQVLGPWAVQPGDWVELGYLDDSPNSVYVRSPLFSETRDPALGFKARLTVGDWDAVVDVNGGADYTSIQEALDAGHRTVYVRKGTYSLGAAGLVISNANTALVGESRTETVLDFGGTTGYLRINASRCTLSNLKLTGSQNTTYGAARISAGYALIANCLFESNYRHFRGDSGAVSEHTLLLGNLMLNASGQVGWHEGAYITLLNNIVRNTAERGLQLSGGTSLVNGNYLYLVSLGFYSPGISITGNVFLYSRILLGSVPSHCNITGNHFWQPQGQAIEIGSDLCSIASNVIYDPTGRGIYVSGSRNMVIGNTLHSAGASGIAIIGNRNIVQGNQVHNNAQYGVHVIAGATNNIVANNVALGNVSDQILDEGTGTVLDNNVTS